MRDVDRGRLGVGWATLQAARTPPAERATLTITDVDDALGVLEATSGEGSVAARQQLLRTLFSQATGPEQRLLVGLFGGELRQGALEGVMADAVAQAADVPAAAVRRAAMLRGRSRSRRGARPALTGGGRRSTAVGLAGPASGAADAGRDGDERGRRAGR